MIFDDPTVKEFMIEVVKRCLGIVDNWITQKYQLEKCVDCPSCKKRIVIGKDAKLASLKFMNRQ